MEKELKGKQKQEDKPTSADVASPNDSFGATTLTAHQARHAIMTEAQPQQHPLERGQRTASPDNVDSSLGQSRILHPPSVLAPILHQAPLASFNRNRRPLWHGGESTDEYSDGGNQPDSTTHQDWGEDPQTHTSITMDSPHILSLEEAVAAALKEPRRMKTTTASEMARRNETNWNRHSGKPSTNQADHPRSQDSADQFEGEELLRPPPSSRTSVPDPRTLPENNHWEISQVCEPTPLDDDPFTVRPYHLDNKGSTTSMKSTVSGANVQPAVSATSHADDSGCTDRSNFEHTRFRDNMDDDTKFQSSKASPANGDECYRRDQHHLIQEPSYRESPFSSQGMPHSSRPVLSRSPSYNSEDRDHGDPPPLETPLQGYAQHHAQSYPSDKEHRDPDWQIDREYPNRPSRTYPTPSSRVPRHGYDDPGSRSRSYHRGPSQRLEGTRPVPSCQPSYSRRDEPDRDLSSSIQTPERRAASSEDTRDVERIRHLQHDANRMAVQARQRHEALVQMEEETKRKLQEIEELESVLKVRNQELDEQMEETRRLRGEAFMLKLEAWPKEAEARKEQEAGWREDGANQADEAGTTGEAEAGRRQEAEMKRVGTKSSPTGLGSDWARLPIPRSTYSPDGSCSTPETPSLLVKEEEGVMISIEVEQSSRGDKPANASATGEPLLIPAAIVTDETTILPSSVPPIGSTMSETPHRRDDNDDHRHTTAYGTYSNYGQHVSESGNITNI